MPVSTIYILLVFDSVETAGTTMVWGSKRFTLPLPFISFTITAYNS
jgi:hypothetical protein